MIIETERLILRPFVQEDLDALALILADPDVMLFSLNGPLKDKEKVRDYLQTRILDHYAQFGFGLYATIHKQDQCLIGFVGLLTQFIEEEKKVELAYRLAPAYWGKGLATEAARAVCHYAFDQLHLEELISIIDSKNVRSLQVAKRVGMHYWKAVHFHGFAVGVYALKNVHESLF